MAIENPFFYRGPVRVAADFFGRTQEIEEALGLLCKRQSISIVGARRIGKTSLLFRLIDLAQRTRAELRRYCFVYIDCGSLRQAGPQDLYADLAQGLLLSLEQMRLVQPELVLPEFRTTPSSVAPSAQLQYRELQQLIRWLEQRHVHCVFVLDEFDALSENPHIGAEVFSGLRAFAMQYEVMYMTVSTQPLSNLTYAQFSTLSSPFFNFFVQFRLGPFHRNDAKQLLRTQSARAGLPFDDHGIDAILRMAGLLPLLVQIAGYHAFESLKYHGDLEWKEIQVRFLDDVLPHFRYFWNTLTEPQRRVLGLLPVVSASEASVVQQLEYMGLITRGKDQSTSRHEMFSALFAAFVARQEIPNLYQVPPVTVDLQRHLVLLRGQPLMLAQSEFNLLVSLLAQPGQIVPHAALEAQVNGEDNQDFSHAIRDVERLKTTLKALRQALGDDANCIENVRGLGYRFNPIISWVW